MALSSAQKRINELKEEQAILQQGSEAWKKIDATIEHIEKRLANSLSNMEDFSDSVKSLGAYVGKSNKLFEGMNLLSESMQGSMASISLTLKNMPGDASKFKKEVYKTSDAYKSLGNVLAVNIKKLKKQQITTTQYNESILDSYNDLEEAIDRMESQLDTLTDAQKAYGIVTIRTFKNQKIALESAAKAAERSKKAIQGLEFTTSQFASTGIPAAGEFGKVLETAAQGGKGLVLAMAALGAALGKVAYDLGFVGDKIGTIAEYDLQLAPITRRIEEIKNSVSGLVKVDRAGGKFAFELQRMAAQFEAAAKTALFGNKLGSVGYGAAQLQMAGISAEKIASAMKETSQLMGSNVSAKFGTNVAILAQRTGQSESNIASISDTFMRLDGVSKETSINMQEGMRAMAAQANINLGALMEDVAEASKDALSYQIKSGPALAKAAAFANSIGTKFTDIANAGRSMVLNYKDSIKAEMSLSAMLGRRVDLSQVRALFAAGQNEAAIRALKAQGLNPAQMNMFQQEALKNATGGLDLNTLQKIATRTGRTAELGSGNVEKGNQGFLSRIQDAQGGLNVANAKISIEEANFDLKTRQLEDEAIQKEILKRGELYDLMVEEKRIRTKKDIATGIGTFLASMVGAITSAGLTALMLRKGKLGNVGNMFGKTSSVAASAGGGSGRYGRYIMSNKGKMINEFLPSGKVNPNFTMAKNLGTKPIQQYDLGRSIMSSKGKTINEFLPSGKVNPNFTMAKNLGTNPVMGGASPSIAAASPGVSPTGFKTNFSSGVKGAFRGGAGVLSLVTSAYDYNERKKAGQTTTQAAAGSVAGGIGSIAMGAAGGALAGAAAGAAAGSVIPVVGTIIGGMLGYYLGSSLADNITGANEPTVQAQENIEAQLTQSDIDQSVRDGQLLSDTAYTIELQKEMVAELGLATTLLYEIADYNARGLFQSVNIDGKKVMEALATTSRRQFGVARNIMPSTTVK